jgi:hypothetical protein
VLDNLHEQVVQGRKGIDSDIGSLLFSLRHSMKELPKILQRRNHQNLIEWAGRNLKHWYTNEPADDLWINLNHMPLNSRLKDNATVLILHNLQMSIELSDQPGEYDADTIVEVAPVICLNDLTDNIKRTFHYINLDNIPVWNDQSVSYSGSGSNTAFLCTLLDPALRAVGRYDSAKNNKKSLPKIISMILDFVSPKKNSAL